LHEGRWIEDFHKLVEEKKAEIATEKQIESERKAVEAAAEKDRQMRILADY